MADDICIDLFKYHCIILAELNKISKMFTQSFYLFENKEYSYVYTDNRT